MTQAIMQTLVCDKCGAEEDVQTMRLTIGPGKTKYVELCAEDRQPILDIQKLLRANPTPKLLESA